MTQTALVVLGTALHTPSRDGLEVLQDCAFVVDSAGRIAEVIPPGARQDEVVAEAEAAGILHRMAPETWLIPGLVDLHIHAPQWPQLGLALDEPLEVWLQKYTFPLEVRYQDSAFATEVYDDLVRSLLAQGTTTALYFGTVHKAPNLILAEACLRHGQRALVGKVAMDDPATCPEFYRDADAATALAETRDFITELRAMQGENPLVLPVITPRFIPSCTDELLAGLGKLAAETGCHVQTHASESDWAKGYVEQRLGCSDCEALDGFGLMTERTVLAHCNFVSDPDMGLMAERGVAVAHCPMSNAYFANAIFPMRRALERGVEAGLGTDISGGFSPSLLDGMRHALMSSRHLGAGTDPGLSPDQRGSNETPLSAVEVFWLATAGGGEALSLPIGQLREGFYFDALVIRANLPRSGLRVRPEITRHQEILEKIVLTADAAAIGEVWVQGRKVLEQ
ncbi:guanine deaminase [Xinfangfangia sp. CPCC 101601]|uniref:Guanine deaminase n=1 Tax=Pseudogemmobacter lacusdianii TaxID=3069608 RepID=A0ABU0W1P6_9RHOB|nr:guanine deaminase [Xinfangfangia sp. CPCC 101601]MDQ2066990.1 guanine deaminase [Xinfangfangia sp. CPCC 101601]